MWEDWHKIIRLDSHLACSIRHGIGGVNVQQGVAEVEFLLEDLQLMRSERVISEAGRI